MILPAAEKGKTMDKKTEKAVLIRDSRQEINSEETLENVNAGVHIPVKKFVGMKKAEDNKPVLPNQRP